MIVWFLKGGHEECCGKLALQNFKLKYRNEKKRTEIQQDS